MAGPLRITGAGLVHHIMNRGTARRDIFEDDKERLDFLEASTVPRRATLILCVELTAASGREIAASIAPMASHYRKLASTDPELQSIIDSVRTRLRHGPESTS